MVSNISHHISNGTDNIICCKYLHELPQYRNFYVYFCLAMKPHEIQEKLGLTRIRDRNWYVQPSCATTGDGLYEGLTWLTSNHKS